ncbi:MAG: hypothetical protein HXN36_03185 [Prevotella histicola]|uniref:hypothetical protein n=1 Tax=Prevotella histicola TaxID=470565 RepID=UPI001CB3574C|nr:hypothetical protein [Prevotella histicola]MBF1393940.1 hypothetical protein [Prevotella histicola]
MNKERKCCGFVATKTAAGMAAACGKDGSLSPFPCLFFEVGSCGEVFDIDRNTLMRWG